MAIKGRFPAIRPSLDLNFAKTKRLDPRITFTRASSGTYVGRDGLIKTAGVNEARFDHNPTTGESLGLLVEEQRTNLLLRSEAMATSPWFGGTNTTLTNNTGEVLDPAGGSTATKVVVSGGAGAFGQSATLTAAIHTGSIWLRCATGTISASLIVYLGASPFTNIGTTNVTITTTWQRFSVVTSTATATAYNLQLNNIAVGTVYAWGAQLEVGAFPTSYIPTTTAAATRSADVASITGSNFSSWFNASQFTFYADILRGYSGNFPAFPNFASLNDGTAANNISLYGTQGNQNLTNFGISSGGVTQNDFVGRPSNFPGPNLIAQALTINSSMFAVNGVLTTEDTSITMPVGINQLRIGSDRSGLAQWGGHIRRLTYWPQRLSNATLQALTS